MHKFLTSHYYHGRQIYSSVNNRGDTEEEKCCIKLNSELEEKVMTSEEYLTFLENQIGRFK